MDDYEREFVERALQNLAPSIALALRDGVPDETVLTDRDSLSPAGCLWVHGYLTCRLSSLRADTEGQPTPSADDLQELHELVEEEQGRVAAELYS